MSYDLTALSDYYASPKWAAKRNERLIIDGFKCARCGFTRALEVHHINYERLFDEDVSRDLITLCKKCHRELEEQKKMLNPIDPPEHHFAYLAGAIKKNDWRNNFIHYRGEPHDPRDIGNGYIAHVNNNLSITGPFFIACDHGCYHGDTKHGVGAVSSLHPSSEEVEEGEWGGCMGNYYTKDDVLNICKEQIDKADIVFAYIDCDDCYGTLAEIGYAHAKGKDIVIVFGKNAPKDEMWFASKMQQRTGAVSDEWIKEHLLSKFKEG